MSDHSLISPSMLNRMFQCPGSVLASVGYPDTSSPAAAHGTMLHNIAEEVLRIGFTDASSLESDDWQMVQDYVAYVKDIKHGPGAHLYVEHDVSLRQYVTDMRGSIDALVVSDNAIHCIDLKTGAHPVSAENNSQLLAYALGATDEFDGWAKEIYVHIWQPGNISTTRVTEDELTQFSEKLMASSTVALEAGAPRNPSDDACRFCKAAPECPALYGQQLAVVGGDFTDLTAPEKLTDEQIATVVLNRARIEKWMKGVWTYALDRHNRNEPLTGVKVVEGRAMRKFTTAGKAALVEYLGDDAYEQKVIGVTAADKLLGKELVDAMTVKVGSPTLAGLDDPRPAATNVIDDFDHLN